MKKTYYRTLFHRELENAQVILDITDGFKWNLNSEVIEEKKYTGVTSWDLIEGGEEAEEIEKTSSVYDENHEYLVLHFKDGHTEIFRNSYVAMFIL